MKQIIKSIICVFLPILLIINCSEEPLEPTYETSENYQDENLQLLKAVNRGRKIISFIAPLSGIDGDLSGWSLDQTTVFLNVPTWSLLDGFASVSGYVNDGYQNLSQRGNKGLGVQGNDPNEIDEQERIVVQFNNPVYLKELIVGSLYFRINRDEPEEGEIDVFLEGELVKNIHLVGVDLWPGYGLLGIVDIKISKPILCDQIEYYVPDKEDYNDNFAVAQIKIMTRGEHYDD